MQDPVALALAAAREKAIKLFQRIDEEGLLRPGRTETELSDDIFELGKREFGVTRHWHRRIVRAGVNTRLAYRANPPVHTLEADDIAYLDLGPVFGEFEADFGRTYVLGSDPRKLRLRDDLEPLFERCRAIYHAEPDMTGGELYRRVVAECEARGWGFGNWHAGHLVGSFPTPVAERDGPRHHIQAENEWSMREPDVHGKPRHWVLEILLLDPSGGFGGFYEDLL
jgi:Xaa-Pro dipeptidase